MATKTEVLADVVMDVETNAGIDVIVDRLGTSLGWPALEDLRKCKLEGFNGPFVRVLQAGKLVYDDTQGTSPCVGDVGAEQPLVVVLQRLVAEGWRLRTPESYDLWSSTDEEEDGWQTVPAY